MENNKNNFTGFTVDTFNFLKELRENNNKEWFEEHREEYKKYLLQPFQKLVSDLSGFMLSIDPAFIVIPSSGKTISRINRDIRFSKNKSPYRSNMWITFKRPGTDWKGDPVYYFEIMPEFYRYGMGYYTASKDMMDKFREAISKKPEEFLKVVSFMKHGVFQLEGDRYKRRLKNELPEELDDWYQMKSFYLACNREIGGSIYKRELVDEIKKGFEELKPLYDFLWKLKAQV